MVIHCYDVFKNDESPTYSCGILGRKSVQRKEFQLFSFYNSHGQKAATAVSYVEDHYAQNYNIQQVTLKLPLCSMASLTNMKFVGVFQYFGSYIFRHKMPMYIYASVCSRSHTLVHTCIQIRSTFKSSNQVNSFWFISKSRNGQEDVTNTFFMFCCTLLSTRTTEVLCVTLLLAVALRYTQTVNVLSQLQGVSRRAIVSRTHPSHFT